MYEEIEQVFRRNVQAVQSIINLDKEIIDLTLHHLESKQKKLKQHIDNPHLDLSKTIKMVGSIRAGGTLSKRYDVVRNQCIVLLVSYFGSAVGDLFRAGLRERASEIKSRRLLDYELKLRIADLQTHSFDLKDAFPDLFLEDAGISFQDMKSLREAFADYLEVQLPKDECMNNIITAQAFRHALAHAGARVDKKLIRQLQAAAPRTLKLELVEDQEIQFREEEITAVIDDMQTFIERIATELSKHQSRETPPNASQAAADDS